MDRKASKKSKIKVDKSAKIVIFQLVYDFLKRDDETRKVAELLKKKTKLVLIFISIHCTQCFGERAVSIFASTEGVMLNYAGEAPEAGDGYTPRLATGGRRPRRRHYVMTEQSL